VEVGIKKFNVRACAVWSGGHGDKATFLTSNLQGSFS
jgi:hypothetical protein